MSVSFMQNFFATCWFYVAQSNPSFLVSFFFLVYLNFMLPVDFHITYYLQEL